MLRYRVLLVGFILSVAVGLETSHAGLPERLQEFNFSLYPVACPANNLILRDLKGSSVDLAALRNKVVVLNFWRIDCPSCAKEKPILERIHRKYTDRGLVVVSVNLFDDADKQRAHIKARGYSYAFASDPDHAFPVRTQTLASGASTNFVINSRAEALYEIPALPTTYLIDREGRVVGNSVGAVDWEEGPMAELLESLLAAQTRVTDARDPDGFSVQARQGTGSPAAGRDAGPVARPTAPPSVQVPQAPTGLTPPKEPAARLPFQGTGSSQPQATGPTGQTESTPSGGVGGARQHLVEPKPGVARPADRTKKPAAQSVAPTEKPAQAKRRPGAPAQPGTAPPAAGTPAPAPAAAGSPPGTSPPSGQAVLPALPPALPYSPTQATAVPPGKSVAPDADGTVQARIPIPPPGRWPGGGPGGVGPADTSGLPAAQPLGGENPFSGFILDSFGQGKPTRIPPPTAQQPLPIQPQQRIQAPAPGLFGQLSQDVQQLGAGIRDVFQRIVPGK
jgi:peroxiredoxin